MTRLLLTNSNLYVEEADSETIELIADELKWSVPGAYFTNSKYWDGYKRFFDKRTKKCMAGFFPFVTSLLDDHEIEYEVEDGRTTVKRKKPLTHQQWNDKLKHIGFEPSEFVSKLQADTARKGLRAYHDDYLHFPRGIFAIATGGGKTSLAALCCLAIKKPVLILLGRLHLMYQTKGVLEKILGEPVGLLGGGHRDIQRVTILMSQTGSKLKDLDPHDDEIDFKKFLKTIKMVILDEAHHITSDNQQVYGRIIQACTNAYYRYALTATPGLKLGADDASLVGLFGPVIERVRSKVLRDEGALAHVRTFMVQNRKCEPFKTSGKDPRPIRKQGIHLDFERHGYVIRAARLFAGRSMPALILVDQPLAHGENLQEAFRMMAGEEVPLINYKTSNSEREKLLKQLESTELKYIIASIGVFGEGIDAPNIRALIRAEGGSNEIRTLQAVGRGMRRKPHPNVLYLVDFTDPHNPVLEKEAKKRMKIYGKEEYEICEIQDADEIEFEETSSDKR